MLWHIAEWAVAVLAAGVVAGLVAVVAAAAGAWLLFRKLRQRMVAFTSTAGYALQAASGVARGRRPLPPRVVHDLRKLINGPPELR
jgi:hypothetical protein